MGLNKTSEAISVFKILRERNFNNDSYKYYLLSQVALKYFKNNSELQIENLEKEEDCDYVLKNFCLEDLSPNSATIYKYIILKFFRDLLDKDTKQSAEKVLNYGNNLDYNLFSDSERKAKVDERVYFSEREAFFTYKINALLKTGHFSECVILCDFTLGNIKNLHHKNYFWIPDKKLRAELELKRQLKEDPDSLFDEYIILSNKARNPWIYNHLAESYFNFNQYEKSLQHYCQAFLCEYDKRNLKLKIGIVYKIGILCEKQKILIMAKIFFALQIKIIKDNCMDESRTLSNKKLLYNINDDFKIPYNDIINFCIQQISNLKDYYLGQVIFIQGNMGKISCKNFLNLNIKFFIDKLLNRQCYNNYTKNQMIAFTFQDQEKGHTKNCFIGV